MEQDAVVDSGGPLTLDITDKCVPVAAFLAGVPGAGTGAALLTGGADKCLIRNIVFAILRVSGIDGDNILRRIYRNGILMVLRIVRLELREIVLLGGLAPLRRRGRRGGVSPIPSLGNMLNAHAGCRDSGQHSKDKQCCHTDGSNAFSAARCMLHENSLLLER